MNYKIYIAEQPNLEIEEITGKMAGLQTIYASCDQDGILYYLITQSKDFSGINSTIIINKLKTYNTTQTDIDDKISNPYREIYGSNIAVSHSQQSISIVGKLESEKKYYIQMYCVNNYIAIFYSKF